MQQFISDDFRFPAAASRNSQGLPTVPSLALPASQRGIPGTTPCWPFGTAGAAPLKRTWLPSMLLGGWICIALAHFQPEYVAGSSAT